MSFRADGYGQICRYGRKIAAHRFVYEECLSPIPEGMFVLHRCDNKRCVNPDHLFLGTQKDNIRDAIIKGRMRQMFRERFGSNNPRSKLGEDGTRWIRKFVDAGASKADAGRLFGVTKERAGQIIKECRYD